MLISFKQKDKGFTLVEIIVTIGIFTVIMLAVSEFSKDIFIFNNLFSNGLTSYDEASKVLQPVASEIRSASPSSLGSYPLEKTDATSFIFFSDINNDGLKERVRYFLSGYILMKGVITPTGNPLQYLSNNEVTTEIIHGIRNNGTPIFTYYDTNYNGDSASLAQPVSPISVRLVKVTLIIDNDPNRAPAPITVTTQISIRNLKDNL